MKYIIFSFGLFFACICWCSCSNSSNKIDESSSNVIEIPRNIGGVELLAPISQYPQFGGEGGSPKYRLLDGVKQYYNSAAKEFEPRYVGVKDGRIVYIAVEVYGVSHVEAAEKEIEKYGNGSDGKTIVEVSRPIRLIPSRRAVTCECIVYVDATYKKEIDRAINARELEEQNKLKSGLNNL